MLHVTAQLNMRCLRYLGAGEPGEPPAPPKAVVVETLLLFGRGALDALAGRALLLASRPVAEVARAEEG